MLLILNMSRGDAVGYRSVLPSCISSWPLDTRLLLVLLSWFSSFQSILLDRLSLRSGRYSTILSLVSHSLNCCRCVKWNWKMNGRRWSMKFSMVLRYSFIYKYSVNREIIEVIKLYAWEVPMEEHINDIRNRFISSFLLLSCIYIFRELDLIKKSQFVKNLIDTFNTASPFMVLYLSSMNIEYHCYCR